jgi:hypothetical protein
MTTGGGAARRGWWWLAVAYVGVCTAVAALVFFAPSVNPLTYWVMVLLTLPLSGIAFLVHYVGFITVFGLEDWWLPRALGFLMWVGVAVAQVVIARVLVRALRSSGATGTTAGGATG